MANFIIDEKKVQESYERVALKMHEIGFVNHDHATLSADLNALAIALTVGNESLIYGAFEYLMSGVGFKMATPSLLAKKRELYSYIQSIIE